MARELDPRRIEILDPLVVAALKRMTPQQRVEAVFDSHETSRRIVACSIRARRPHLTPEELERAIARRLLGESA